MIQIYCSRDYMNHRLWNTAYLLCQDQELYSMEIFKYFFVTKLYSNLSIFVMGTLLGYCFDLLVLRLFQL